MTRILPTVLVAMLASTGASARNCRIDLDSNDQMRFDQSTLTVSAACAEITVHLRHSGTLPANVMGHNVVITATDDYLPVAQAAIPAGVANGYVPAGDARIIAHTSLIGGGETTSTRFPGSRLRVGGDYTFFCSFPGHWTLMIGKLEVE